MIEWLQNVWDFTYNFLVIGIIGYLVRKWLAEKVMKLWVNKSERTIAIWTHHMSRAKGEGHDHVDVLDCHDQRCKVFTSYAN